MGGRMCCFQGGGRGVEEGKGCPGGLRLCSGHRGRPVGKGRRDPQAGLWPVWSNCVCVCGGVVQGLAGPGLYSEWDMYERKP